MAYDFLTAAHAGPQDFPKIHVLQDQLKVMPLNYWGTLHATDEVAQWM